MAVSIRFTAALSVLCAIVLPPILAVPLTDGATTTTTSATITTSGVVSQSDTDSVLLPNKATIFEDSSTITGSSIGSTTLTPGALVPSGFYNPNGPYYNPNDYTSLPFTWPGKPTDISQSPPPRPKNPPYPSGGENGDQYQAPAWVPEGISSLTSALPQSDTNGNSEWGLVDNQPLVSSAQQSGSSQMPTATSFAILPRATISNTTTNGTDACGAIPDTGVTRSYDFTVSYQKIAPDGVEKNGLVVNGGFPGPLIEANWGDWIEIQVTNNLTDEGTALHWHGLIQAESPWFDGVPAVSQCPIPPGGSLLYRFRADVHGTSWYHSHYSAQYAGGALGPIVIHGPQTADYDLDLGPIMLSDWYHSDYFTLVNNTMNGAVPASNNNLINGKMNYPCNDATPACTPNAGISKFSFQSGKKHLLRLINTSGEGIQKFTIDGHNFTVIANDFVPIQPYTTNVITLGIGQRSDVIVEAASQPGGSYWMRANLGTVCSVTDGVSPEAVAAVYYEDADTTAFPTTSSSLTTDQLNDCGNDPLEETVALCSITPDPNPPATETIDITFGSNGTSFLWFMNGSSFRGNYNDPVLAEAKLGNLSFPADYNVYNFGSNSSVRLVVRNFFQFGAHPMHLHGHNFHVLAEGFGDWDGTVINPDNTQMRDVQLIRPAQDADTPSYIVLQWIQDNPAVWPFHCHIAWHVSAGLYINILERPADIQQREFPDSFVDTCSAWAEWTGTNIVNQIDSGL